MNFDVVVIGGGIQGAAAALSLASRGSISVALVEKGKLAQQTSSRSTKLIHGGLRYLEKLSQWPLVQDALKERTLLSHILPELISPVPIIVPLQKDDIRPAWFVRTGLHLYDFMSTKKNPLPKAKSLSVREMKDLAPYLNENALSRSKKGFVYYDAQTQDDTLTRLTAYAASRHGATILTDTQVDYLQKEPHGFRIKTLHGENIVCRKIVMAASLWNNEILIKSDIAPSAKILMNKGSHLFFPDLSFSEKADKMKAGAIFQNKDKRVVFFLPWNNGWLLGTTEKILSHKPQNITPDEEEIKYLKDIAYTYLNIKEKDFEKSIPYAGIRTMPISFPAGSQPLLSDEYKSDPWSSPWYAKDFSDISGLSRETLFSFPDENILVIYGGKLTTFRSCGEKVANLLNSKWSLNLNGSISHKRESWFIEDFIKEHPESLGSDFSLWSS